MVTLSKLGRHPTTRVHILVKEAFDGPTPDGLMVCHENGIADDNRLENLYFGTSQQNALDAIRHGTHYHTNKTHCPLEHAYLGPNLIENMGNQTVSGPGPQRNCRACDNTRSRRSFLRRTGRLDDSFDFKALADIRYAELMAGYVDPVPTPRAESLTAVPQHR